MFLECNAQPKQLQFRYLKLDDGLSSSSILSILQDYKGYMWIGTNVGLNRYDGNEFKIYKNIPDDPTSLLENHVRAIFQDRENNLLLGTFSGLSLFLRDNDCFYNYMTDTKSALYGKYCSVLSMEEDAAGNLWLATNIGLLSFNRTTNTYRQFTHNPEDPESLSNNEVEQVFIDSRGRLWVESREGLDLMNSSSGQFMHITKCKIHAESLSGIFFHSLAEDKLGNLWFGSREGLFFLDNSADPLEDGLVHYKHIQGEENSLSINQARALFIDNENNLWVGTENGGLNLFDRQTNQFWHYRIDPYNSRSLNNESIQVIYQDRTDNLWIGTFAGGLNIAAKNSDAIVHYKNVPGAPHNLSHNVVTCFLDDHTGRIWVGTDGGGINLFDPGTGRFEQFNTNNSSISSNAILCLTEDSHNRIWLGTWAGGLVCFDPENKSFTSFTTKNSSIQDNNIYSIIEGQNDELWLGSFEGGLIKFQINKKRFANFTVSNSKLLNNMISILKKDLKGVIYIGSIKGLQLFNPTNEQFLTFTNVNDDSTSLSASTVVDILPVNDTAVWVATSYGLDLFNPATGKFKQFFLQNGLPDNVIKGIEIDAQNELWVSTNNGLCNFNLDKRKIRLFIKADGIQSNEFCDRSHLLSKDGDLLFGGTNGFNLIHKSRLIKNSVKPEVVITDFRIFYEQVKIGTENSPLKKAIDQTQKIVLSYKQSTITFSFSALDYTIPGKNSYAYRLEPIDQAFNYVGHKNEANYTNLTPGEYIFTVIASNSDGVWNETGTSVEIIVKSPWWRTTLAYMLYILLIIAALVGIYFMQANRLNNRSKQLELMVNQRTKEIEEKNLLLHDQASELNDINTLLEERQQRIEEQHEILISNTEQLKKKNILLEENREYITQQTKKLQTQAEELIEKNSILSTLNNTKDKFFSIIAHDLKNPFNSIMGFTEMLSDKYNSMDDTKRKYFISVIHQSAENIYRLLENLLQWAQSQTGKIRVEPEEFEIGHVISENFKLLENLMLEKHLTEKNDIPPGLTVYADKNMIDTVVRNLITNAVKFSEGGEISVWLKSDDNFVTVYIKDNGSGISAEKAKSLFEIGACKSSEGTRGEPGTGLGLLISSDFIARNGGAIGVESKIGEGSIFYFSLPRKQIGE